jgi:hypothetical protein
MGTQTNVSFRTWDGVHYLCAEPEGLVIANRTAVGPWEEWTVEHYPGGDVALKSAHGRYLCAEIDGELVANRTVVGPWERFRLFTDAAGIGLQSAHGRFVAAENGGGGGVAADRLYSSPGPWETFVPSQLLLSATTPSPVALTRLRVESNRRWFAHEAGRFDWREVSCFALVGMVAAGQIEPARDLLRWHKAAGFTIVRVFVTNPIPPYIARPDREGFWAALDLAMALCAEVGLYCRASLINMTEPWGGVWYPDRRDVWSGSVRAGGEAFAVECAQRLASQPHVVLELANEPGQIGMRESFAEIISLGHQVKAVAPDTLLCAGAVDGPNDQDTTFAREPFDFCDAHIDRLTGVRGFEWVKRTGEYALIDQHEVAKRMPFVSGEPINFGEARRDTGVAEEPSPSVAFAYGAVSRSRQYNACFHFDGGLYGTLPKPETVACITAFMAALDAFPMLTGAKWRGHHGLAGGDYWRDAWAPTDNVRDVERHIDDGRGPWRAFGCREYSVLFPEPEGWDYQRQAEVRVERVAHVSAGAFAAGVYRRV